MVENKRHGFLMLAKCGNCTSKKSHCEHFSRPPFSLNIHLLCILFPSDFAVPQHVRQPFATQIFKACTIFYKGCTASPTSALKHKTWLYSMYLCVYRVKSSVLCCSHAALLKAACTKTTHIFRTCILCESFCVNNHCAVHLSHLHIMQILSCKQSLCSIV